MTTLLVTAPDRHALDELEAVVGAAVRVLSRAMQAGPSGASVVAGAGCTEALLADEVRTAPTQGRGGARPVRRALENFAECLELSAGLRAADAAAVRRRCAEEGGGTGSAASRRHYGWLPDEGVTHVMSTAPSGELLADARSVVDSLEPKLAALTTAVEVANAILRIDSSVEGCE